jgi:hypothetical protein
MQAVEFEATEKQYWWYIKNTGFEKLLGVQDLECLCLKTAELVLEGAV